jgi:ribosome-dependent ATPase
LLLGKLLPYAAIGFIETVLVLLVMVAVFAVPVHGSLPLLLTLATLFLVCALGLGIFVSTLATTQLQAMQLAFNLRQGGIGYYPNAHFLHLDTGPVRSWQSAY